MQQVWLECVQCGSVEHREPYEDALLVCFAFILIRLNGMWSERDMKRLYSTLNLGSCPYIVRYS
jgi:hypothetical protein